MDKFFKTLLGAVIVVGVALSVVMIVDLWNPKRIGKYAYNTIISDLDPESVVERKIEGGDSPHITYDPVRFKNRSYMLFKQAYIDGSNKTVIHQGDCLLFWSPEMELYVRYCFTFQSRIGYPFSEYSWRNPVTKEITTYGWVILDHTPY